MTNITLDKKDVVVRELNQAIRMFFHNEDPICIHLLVCSANNILHSLMNANKQPILLGYNGLLQKIYIKKEFQEEFRKEFEMKRHDFYNFFKHAKKDVNKIIDFNPNLNIYFMFENLIFIKQLNIQFTKEMQYFYFWLYVSHRRFFIKNEEFDNEILKYEFKDSEGYEYFDEFMNKNCL